jgi:hypothetical protein
MRTYSTYSSSGGACQANMPSDAQCISFRIDSASLSLSFWLSFWTLGVEPPFHFAATLSKAMRFFGHFARRVKNSLNFSSELRVSDKMHSTRSGHEKSAVLELSTDSAYSMQQRATCFAILSQMLIGYGQQQSRRINRGVHQPYAHCYVYNFIFLDYAVECSPSRTSLGGRAVAYSSAGVRKNCQCHFGRL